MKPRSNSLGMQNPRLGWIEAGFLVGALGAAFLLRFVYLLFQRTQLEFRAPPLGLDADVYHRLAVRLANGDLALGERIFYYGPLPIYVQGMVYSLVGPDPASMRWLHLGLGVAVVALLFFIARQVAGPVAAVSTAWLAALYAPFIVYDTQVIGTAQANFLLLSGAAVLLRIGSCNHRRELMVASAAGLLFGLAALARPNLLLVIVVATVSLLLVHEGVGGKRRVVLALALGIAAALAIAPATVRNRVVSGEFALISSTAGIHFFVGNHAGANGGMSSLPEIRSSPVGFTEDARRVAEAREGRSLSETEVSRHFARRVFEFVTGSPGQAFALLLQKAYLATNRWELPNNLDLAFESQRWPLLNALPGFGVVGPLCLLGIGIAIWNRQLRILAALAFAYLVTLILTFVTARYRLPFVALALPLAGATISMGVRAAREGELRRVGVGVASLAGLTLLCWSSFGQPAFSRDMEVAEKQRLQQWRRARLQERVADIAAGDRARIEAVLALARLQEEARDVRGAEWTLLEGLEEFEDGASRIEAELGALRARSKGGAREPRVSGRSRR